MGLTPTVPVCDTAGGWSHGVSTGVTWSFSAATAALNHPPEPPARAQYPTLEWILIGRCARWKALRNSSRLVAYHGSMPAAFRLLDNDGGVVRHTTFEDLADVWRWFQMPLVTMSYP